MSYFPDHIDIEKDEIAEGVFIERRQVLKLSTFALGSMLLGSCGPLYAEIEQNSQTKKQEDDKSIKPISFEQLIKQITPLANKLVAAKKPDEEAYLETLKKLTSGLQGMALAKSNNRKIQFTSHHKKIPIKVYQIRMKPGSALPFHDHREYNGLIHTLQGSAQIRNFDFVDDMKKSQKAKSFKIKETANVTSKVGDISHLSSVRDNIHDVRAGKEGVVFLDIFTFFDEKGSSKYLNVDPKVFDKKKKIYQASWR